MSPFISFKSSCYQSLNGNPTLILGSQGYTLIIDGIWVTNKKDKEVVVNLYILREESTTQKPLYTYLVKNLTLSPFEDKDLLTNKSLHLLAEDTIFIYSYHIEDEFDCTVSYRELLETYTGESIINLV